MPSGTQSQSLHPLVELTTTRVREFVREKEAVFWVFVFPVLMTFALGIAFRNTAPDKTLVAIEGAEATLSLPGDDNPDLTALLAKAAAGKAALTAARHCQQVLGGIGFTAEHDLHHHVKRSLVLDGLLGSSRELTRKAGAGLRARGSAPRLAQL